MNPDFDACYRAVRSRDARFDGRFFTAVTLTGIYCRPICPSPPPLAANMRFYTHAAAAEAAGFRACRRCHPEKAPGSPEWNVRADLVGRALRLIAESAADDGGVGGVAARLGVSARHLHRALVAEVGVGPLALARTRRAQTARLLIDQTSLPLTTISGAAGFTSIRQFNETMRASFGCNPTALRRCGPEAPGGGGLALRLPYRPPLAAATLLSYFGQRAVAGVEEVVDGRYRRTVALPHARGVIELEPLANAGVVLLRLCLDDLRDLGPLVQRCRHLLDLDADPAAIGAILGADALLAPLVAARPGLRVPGAIDGFELAVRAILGQQISIAGARTLAGRLVAALGEPLDAPRGALTHTFPTPDRVAGANLGGLGLTGGRIVALQSLARAITEGSLTLDRGADWERTAARLHELPGVGPWTASYIAMRALGDPDACPVADLGLRRALERRGLAADQKSVAARAEAWRPWRAYATHHLWASLAIPSAAG